jgi:hypothetical protein
MTFALLFACATPQPTQQSVEPVGVRDPLKDLPPDLQKLIEAYEARSGKTLSPEEIQEISEIEVNPLDEVQRLAAEAETAVDPEVLYDLLRQLETIEQTEYRKGVKNLKEGKEGLAGYRMVNARMAHTEIQRIRDKLNQLIGRFHIVVKDETPLSVSMKYYGQPFVYIYQFGDEKRYMTREYLEKRVLTGEIPDQKKNVRRYNHIAEVLQKENKVFVDTRDLTTGQIVELPVIEGMPLLRPTDELPAGDIRIGYQQYVNKNHENAAARLEKALKTPKEWRLNQFFIKKYLYRIYFEWGEELKAEGKWRECKNVFELAERANPDCKTCKAEKAFCAARVRGD